jgi:hypothetical protein
VKLFNSLTRYSVYPNPFNNYVLLKIEKGKYHVQITDQTSRVVLNRFVNTSNNNEDVKLPVARLGSGVYFLRLIDEQGTPLVYEKIVK